MPCQWPNIPVSNLSETLCMTSTSLFIDISLPPSG